MTEHLHVAGKCLCPWPGCGARLGRCVVLETHVASPHVQLPCGLRLTPIPAWRHAQQCSTCQTARRVAS